MRWWWPRATRAAGSVTGTTSGVLSNIKWLAIAVPLSPHCSYLNISKPNYCWGRWSLRPSNGNFLPAQRKGLLGKGWERKLSSTLQRSNRSWLHQVQPDHALPFLKVLQVQSLQGKWRQQAYAFYTSGSLFSFFLGAGRLLARAYV